MAKLPFRHISVSDNQKLIPGSLDILVHADSRIHCGNMKTYNLQDRIEGTALIVLGRIQSGAVILGNNIRNNVKSMLTYFS